MIHITVVALGDKMPAWIQTGVEEYLKRLKEFAQCRIIEMPLIKRPKNGDISRIMTKEASFILNAIPKDAHIIALVINGQRFSSEGMAQKLMHIGHHTSHLCFLIGGPEGLASTVIEKSHSQWSLSDLTLPHPLVRVLLLESLYRAFSINANHPYHK